MPTWEEGQDEAQRNSRNRVFGGTRSLGGAVGGTRDLSGNTGGERNPSIFGNLRNNRGGSVSGGVTPNYGMGGSSRYPQSQFGGAITQNGTGAITGSAGSRGMRRGRGGDVSVDDSSGSGNVTIQFAPQDSRSGNISGNVAGTGAVQDNRQDNSTNVDASSRNINGNVGNSLQQDASGGESRSGDATSESRAGDSRATATATATDGSAPAEPAKKARTRRNPEDISPDERAKMDRRNEGERKRRADRKEAAARETTVTADAKAAKGGDSESTATTGNSDARGGRNDGSVGGDIDMSSGRRGPSVLDGPPAGGAQPSTPSGDNNDNSTNVRTGDTGGNNQQVGDNPSTSTTTTTNTTTPPPRDPDSPPSRGDSPRSTERPTPSGDSPERPTIPMTDPGTGTTGTTQPPRGRGRRGWFDGRGPNRATPADVEGLSERIEPSRTGRPSIPMNDVEPTQVMPTTRGGGAPTRRTDRPNVPMGDTSDDGVTSEDIMNTFFPPGTSTPSTETPKPAPERPSGTPEASVTPPEGFQGSRSVPEDKQLPMGEPKVVNDNKPTPAADLPPAEKPAKKERAPRKSKAKDEKTEKVTVGTTNKPAEPEKVVLDDVKKPKPETVTLDDVKKPETKTETNDKPKEKPKGNVKIVDGVPTFVPDK